MTRLDCQNWHGRSGKLRKHWGDLCRSKDCHHLSHRKHLRTSSCRGYCMSRQTVYQRRQEHETGYLGDRTDYVHLLPAVQTGHQSEADFTGQSLWPPAGMSLKYVKAHHHQKHSWDGKSLDTFAADCLPLVFKYWLQQLQTHFLST